MLSQKTELLITIEDAPQPKAMQVDSTRHINKLQRLRLTIKTRKGSSLAEFLGVRIAGRLIARVEAP